MAYLLCVLPCRINIFVLKQLFLSDRNVIIRASAEAVSIKAWKQLFP